MLLFHGVGYYRVKICITILSKIYFYFTAGNCRYYAEKARDYQCKETVITAENKSILHLKNGAKSALGERDLVGCWERKKIT